jgi:hypothetical protein
MAAYILIIGSDPAQNDEIAQLLALSPIMMSLL